MIFLKFTDYDDTELKHLQNLELMILKDFIHLCDKNNLDYYIYGGSLLGAVRHKGFIPWDDDIDMIMFRDDFEKFKEIFMASDNDKYELLSYETNDEYFFLFSKLILKNTKFEEWWVNQVNFTVGINIDIFVLDYVSDSKIKGFFQVKSCRLLDKLSVLSVIKLEGYPFFIQLISNFINFIFRLFHIKPATIRRPCLNLLCRYDNTKRVCDISALNHPQIYNVDDFLNGTKIRFEDIEVNAPSNYHNILQQIYGDYMKLPPEEERYNHITENFDFGDYGIEK